MEDVEKEILEVLSKTPCPGYAHAPHTADVLVIGRGRRLEEAFEQAALGVYEIITDTSKVEERIEKSVEAEGLDLYQLLYRWIEELLFYTDVEKLVFSKFKIEELTRVGGGEEAFYKLKAKAWGEVFNPEKHPPRTIVKAMTYASMDIVKEDGCWRVQFVVDI